MIERAPYSEKKDYPRLDVRLPQDMSADEEIKRHIDEQLRADRKRPQVNLGYAARKGRRA